MPPSNRDPAHEEYDPDGDRRLSTAVLEAVGTYTGEDIGRSEFRLYDAIDPDALDALFRHESAAGTTVTFEVGEVVVEIAGDGTVDIFVTDALD